MDTICIDQTNLLRVTFEKNKVKFGITASYRPPSTNLGQYITCINNFIETLKKQKIEIFIGDINVNILDNNDINTITYLTTLAQLGFLPYINKPTRVTENTRSIIDHIFVRVGDKILTQQTLNIKPVLFETALTDHYTILLSVEYKKKNRIPTNKQIHTHINKISHNKLSKLLQKENWLDVIQKNDAEISYKIFIEKLNNFIGISTTKIKLTNKTRKIKPWITAGIINSIRHRDNLKKIYIKNKSHENKVEYTQYRNMLYKLIRHTKNDYYKNKIENAQHNYKKIWQAINEASNTQKKTQRK